VDVSASSNRISKFRIDFSGTEAAWADCSVVVSCSLRFLQLKLSGALEGEKVSQRDYSIAEHQVIC
jgi:hypothetical protein